MGHLVRGRDRAKEVRDRVTLGLGFACGPPALAPCSLAPA